MKFWETLCTLLSVLSVTHIPCSGSQTRLSLHMEASGLASVSILAGPHRAHLAILCAAFPLSLSPSSDSAV